MQRRVTVKKIVLIGDSIRIGYDVLVKEAFKGTAEVYFPEKNCCFAEYILRHLHEWKETMKCGDDVDCVHWNVGLWDTLILFEDGPLTPLDVYELYMERLCKRIKILFPKAKVIFATSTPMYEELFTTPEISVRYNRDIEIYNEAAIRIVKKHGHEINDLYGLMKDKPLSYHSDVAHYYSRNGAKLLAPQVCEAISKTINVEYEPINYDKWFADVESYDGTAWLKKRNELLASNIELGI